MEGGDAVDLPVLGVGGGLVELLDALLQGVGEPVLLPLQLGEHLLPVLLQLGVHVAVLVDDGGGHVHETVPGDIELHGVADASPDEPPEDVALVHVGGGHAPLVAQDEGGAADVVRDDAEGLHRGVAFLIRMVAELADELDDAGEGVGVEHALHALERGDGPVETHAGVHVLLGEGLELPFAYLIIFHEHVVPDLQILAAVAAGLAVGTAGGAAGIVEDLRVGAAGAGEPGGAPPVVLLGQVHDVGGVHAHLHPPVVGDRVPGRVRVAFEAGEGEFILGDAQPLLVGQELPAPGDGFLLEVVAQRPVAQHLKEGAVGGVADLVDVAGADALLHVREPGAGGVLLAHQVGYQRMHARGGEEHRGIILGDQGRTGDHRVALGTEEVQIQLPKLPAGQIAHRKAS